MIAPSTKPLLGALAITLLLILSGCSPKPISTISELEASLEKQFKQQWKEKRDPANNHYIKSVQIDSFNASGSVTVASVTVRWDDYTTISSAPVSPLGSAVAFTVKDPTGTTTLNALATFR